MYIKFLGNAQGITACYDPWLIIFQGEELKEGRERDVLGLLDIVFKFKALSLN